MGKQDDRIPWQYHTGLGVRTGGSNLNVRNTDGTLAAGVDFTSIALGTGEDDRLIKGGTSAVPLTKTAAGNFIEYRLSTSATSGDNRGMYLRLYSTGINTTGGEALRAMHTVSAALGTARGAHISLNWLTGGSVSGLGTAVSGTLHLLAAGMTTGTVAVLEAQAYADGTLAAGVPAEHGLIRLDVGGNATGQALFKNVIQMTTNANITGNKAAKLMICNADVTGGGGASGGGLHIRVGGTPYWIPFYAE